MYGFIADTHMFVKLKPCDFMKSLTEFLRHIKEHEEPCHGIFVVGDLFDHHGNDDDMYFASLFIIALVCNNCGRNGRQHVPVYFIQGTYSHDHDQYRKYLPLLEKIPNTTVFYYNETCAGTTFDGKSILFLPQIYGDFDYMPFFKDKHYDIIVGHGPISSSTKCPCKTSGYEILHSAETLGEISNICVFGHYHGFCDFGNNVFYTGPWLRWKYGENEDRVFMYCDDNLKPFTFPNPIAIEYKTIEINKPEELRTYLSNEVTTPHRFVINVDSQSDMATYHGIISNNKLNENMKFKLQQKQTCEDKKIDNTINDDIDNNSNELGPISSLVAYIKNKYSEDTEQEIESYVQKINKNENNENTEE